MLGYLNFKNKLFNNLNKLVIAVIQFIFWAGILRYIDLPGLYHDVVNPDYIAAHSLNDQFNNPGGALASKWFPMLGNIYHGVQNYYVDLPIFYFFWHKHRFC